MYHLEMNVHCVEREMGIYMYQEVSAGRCVLCAVFV